MFREVVLDKTADGRYWWLDGTLEDGRVLRLRCAYGNPWDPDEMTPELGVKREPDGDVAFTALGEPFEFVKGTTQLDPVDEWSEDFPEPWRPQFVALAKIWGEATAWLDLGPAFGRWGAAPGRPDQDSRSA